MGELRKVFRIQGIAATRRTVQTEDTTAAPGYAEVMQELSALRALIAPSAQSAAPKGPQRAGVDRLATCSNITVVIFCWHICLISESMGHHDSEIMDDRSID